MTAIRKLQAVQFGGSSTQVHAINHWMKEGTYKAPQVVTCDLRHFFFTDINQLKVNCGDYVVKHEDGTFSVMSPEQFGRL